MTSILKTTVVVAAAFAFLGMASVSVAQQAQLVLNNQTTLPDGFTDSYRVVMLAGQDCWVRVDSTSNTDLDLFIYDSRGNLVTSDTTIGSSCYCSWSSPVREVYTVRVRNLGPNPGRYRIRSN